MNSKAFFKTLMVSLSLFPVFSCQKTTVDPVSTEAATATISAPLVDDSFKNDDDIKIKGNVTDANTLRSLTIKVTDDKTNAVLYTVSPTVTDLKAYNFDVNWKAKVTDWVDATVTVVVLNKNNVQTMKSVKVKVWL